MGRQNVGDQVHVPKDKSPEYRLRYPIEHEVSKIVKEQGQARGGYGSSHPLKKA